MKRVAIATLLCATTAHAGGLSRPSGISARGTGMGGAYTAWADDATAVWFNPAALSDIDPQIQIGAEAVLGPRTYTPVADDGTRGADQSATVFAPLPALGVVGRFWYEDRPSRFTLGAGLWNTFGGQVSFPKTGLPALDSTQDAVVEASAGTALRVSDRLSVGAAFRIGLGLFSVDTTMLPFDSKLSATGVGVAMTWGFLFKPTDHLRIGLTWHSPMHITTSGNGTVVQFDQTTQQQVEHVQNWPQHASLGVGVLAAPRIKLSAQLDWTQWSTVKQLVVGFPAKTLPDQIYREDWRDNWTARLGAEVAATPTFAVRAGTYFDTNAVPDRSSERQYLDSDKIGVSAGASLTLDAWRVDYGMDFVLPNTRVVPNNNAQTAAFPDDRNKAPGDYKGLLVTFELAVARRF